MVTGIAEDTEHNIWAAVIGTSRTLIRIQNMTVQEPYPDPAIPPSRRIAADPTGGIWLGLVNGDLAHYQSGRLTTYKFAHDQAATVHQLVANDDGSIFAATSYGLAGWQKGKLMNLAHRNGLPCDVVNAMSFDNQGNLWLFMDCAIGEMTSVDLQRWRENPNAQVSIKTLDVLDGVHTGRAPFVSAARSSDGKLWFVNGLVLQMFDPTQLSHNPFPPPVHIEQIVADRKSYPVAGAIQFPPRTRDIEIDYAGLSFVAPQKVFFRYRLEGRDKNWQEPGTRRQAVYNDLRPGTYRFRVIACNNDGVWNEEGATLVFTVAPAWFQTAWFNMLCVLVAVIVAWVLYCLRVRQVASAMSSRFDERLAERTRMARELHDTFLQTIQGSKLVADDAIENVHDPVRTRHALEQLSEWLSRATQEGRAALRSLRTSTTEANDLAAAFRRALEDCRRETSMETKFEVTGDAHEMHPMVRDEVYRIGYEAIRNACAHSSGSRIEVALSYVNDLSLQIRDNGIGIDPDLALKGRKGHFGLEGMRERAIRIGARLTVSSPGNYGTEVTVVVPGRIVFRKIHSKRLDRIRRIFKGVANNRDDF